MECDSLRSNSVDCNLELDAIDLDNKRKQFGNRFLTDEDDVYKHNAWDNVLWNEELEQQAAAAVAKNSTEKMSAENKMKYTEDADKMWDSFYNIHQNRFFKNRQWLFTEFPELAEKSKDEKTTRCIFELGCGVGNTILPILKYNDDEQLKVFGCDFSAKAIEVFRSDPHFDAKRCEVFVMDVTLERWIVPFEENSLDVIVLIFVLSAIEPVKMQRIVENCYKYLRSGGVVLFRDYGRYDLTQLRFKNGKCLDDNLYVRGDGTMVYFFTTDELKQLFCKSGFIEDRCVVDRRLQVNRGKQLKMYRVWIQTKYRKP